MSKKLIRMPKVEDKTGLKKSCIYGKVRIKKFPQPIRLGKRCTVWIEDEVDQWVEQQISSNRQSA